MIIDKSQITTQGDIDALYRNNLSLFTARAFNVIDPNIELIWNWHNDLICEYLTACYNGDIRRLIINVPPRSLKSITATVGFPAWLLGKNPATRILTSSYSHALSIKHSIQTRDIIRNPWYKSIFPEVILSDDTNRQTNFKTTEKGYRLATSVGGSLTGEGGDFLIVDDPINATDAMSILKRQTCLDWFDRGFSTRENDPKKSVIIVIMQRLHENDLTGHLLEKEGWELLKIPMEFDNKITYSFPITKKEKILNDGDLLAPERWGEEEIRKIKDTMGSMEYAGQYQQLPAPADGNIYKKEWFKEMKSPPEKPRRIIQSWDTAYKDQQINDPSCCTTWLEFEIDKKLHYYLADVFNKRLQYPELKQKAISLANIWEVDLVLIEDKASGQSLIQELRYETNIAVKAIIPKGDKISRASSSSSLIENGKVFIPEKAGWKDMFLNQLLTFPNATHDDIVDSVAQFLNYVKYRTGEITAEIW